MKRFPRWTLRVLGGVAGLLLLATAGAAGELRPRQPVQVAGASVATPDHPATVRLGRQAASTRGCVGCHTASPAGSRLVRNPASGAVHAAGATHGRGWTAGRPVAEHGVPREPTLPSHGSGTPGDRHLAAVDAYLRSLPPADRVPGRGTGCGRRGAPCT